jgi:hypothetical protein
LSDLKIVEWQDEDYMLGFFLEGNYSRLPNFLGSANTTHSHWHSAESQFHNETVAQALITSINKHRYRRLQFVEECLRYVYKTGTDRWMAHIDTEEYLAINPLSLAALRDGLCRQSL